MDWHFFARLRRSRTSVATQLALRVLSVAMEEKSKSARRRERKKQAQAAGGGGGGGVQHLQSNGNGGGGGGGGANQHQQQSNGNGGGGGGEQQSRSAARRARKKDKGHGPDSPLPSPSAGSSGAPAHAAAPPSKESRSYSTSDPAVQEMLMVVGSAIDPVRAAMLIESCGSLEGALNYYFSEANAKDVDPSGGFQAAHGPKSGRGQAAQAGLSDGRPAAGQQMQMSKSRPAQHKSSATAAEIGLEKLYEKGVLRRGDVDASALAKLNALPLDMIDEAMIRF